LPIFFMYAIGYYAVRFSMTKRWLGEALQAAGTLLVAGLAVLLTSASAWERLQAYWNPDPYSSMAGYMTIKMKEAIADSGWLGHGFASTLRGLSELHYDGIFVYIIHSFGWLGGIAVAVFAILFVHILLAASRKVRDGFGRAILVGMTSILGCQIAYNMLMAIGLVPLTSMPFPFVSSGGNHLLAELGAVGLMLGVYRRKDLVSTQNVVE